MKSLITTVLALGLLVPSLAFAQSAGTGLLNVYVQVVNPSSNCYNQTFPYTNCSTPAPSNFTVSVSGQNPSVNNFQGSQQGTLVTLNPGAYSVALTGNQYNYTADYSVGCNATIAAGQNATCVITVSPAQAPYYNYPYPPFNGYNPPALSCAPAYQTVAAGQTAQFTAQGGVGGTYNWQTPERSYPNAGPVLSVTFTDTGSKLVTVTNATQSATCSVNVVATGYYPNPQPVYPTVPPYTVVPATPISISSVYPTSPAYPTWPNTGFAPMGGSEGALALLATAVAGLIAFPYVRKAFLIVTR